MTVNSFITHVKLNEMWDLLAGINLNEINLGGKHLTCECYSICLLWNKRAFNFGTQNIFMRYINYHTANRW